VAEHKGVRYGVSRELDRECTSFSAGAEVGILQVGVECLFGDPKAATELHSFELPGMDQPINRHLRESEDCCDLGDGEEFSCLEVACQWSHAPWLGRRRLVVHRATLILYPSALASPPASSGTEVRIVANGTVGTADTEEISSTRHPK